MLDAKRGPVGLDEYLKIDAASPDRLEYRGGYIFALAVPSGNHERIKNNLVAHFTPRLKDTGCDLISGGVKVVCPNIDRAIPDLGVTCDERDRIAMDQSGEAIIEHPWLLIEILSPATQGDDRGGKLDSYRQIPELTHHLLIDSRKQWMVIHERGPDGLFSIKGPIDKLTLPTLGELTFEIAYDGTAVRRIA
jgi:Uma2 family endonuclease